MTAEVENEHSWRLWPTCLLLFVFLWVSFAYFHHIMGGWNVNTRLGLTYAIVDHGTFSIDAYANMRETRTGDLATFNGHLYSDKSIGTSLIAVPVYAALKGVEHLRGARLSWEMRRYILTISTIAVMAAGAGVLLFLYLWFLQVRWFDDRSPVGPIVLSILLFLGTQGFLYATLFMSYLPAWFFTIAAMCIFERWQHRLAAATRPPLFRVGLLMGCSMLCEYTLGIVAMFFGAYVMLTIPNRIQVWRYVLGALVGIAPFIAYSQIIFGRLSIPYEHEQSEFFRQHMSRGLMGITLPSLTVLLLITFHPFRGLFVHSPFLLVAVPGLVRMMREVSFRGLGLLVAAVCLSILLMNSGYYMWWGGYSFGPRHLMPMLPFITVPLLVAWREKHYRVAILLLGAVGIGIHTMVNAVEPQFPDRFGTALRFESLLHPSLSNNYPWPFTRYLWPAFWNGTLKETSANWGIWAGLPLGPASILPLLAWWIFGAAAFHYLLQKPRQQSVPAS